MNPLRIGILSTASIVPRFVGAAGTVDDCVVTAIASRNLEKAAEKARIWRIPQAFGSYEELIASDLVDIVYIATINSEHARYARLALEHGKHVFCEKPFALKPSEIRDCFALAREKGLFVMEMQKCVFLPVVQELKKRIQAGEFGRITIADFSSSFEASYNGWMFDPAMGGGPLYGNAGYSLQLMQFLFDSFVTEQTGLCTRGDSPVENQFAAVMRMENGLIFTNKTSTLSETLHTGFLYGEKGYVELPDYWKTRQAILHFPGQDPVVLDYPCDFELRYELVHALGCIRAGLTESPVMTEEMSVRAIKTLDALHRSWNH